MTTKTKIKFCGLTRFCDIEAANELKPDYIGFVFAPKSKRYVSAEQAAQLRARLAPGITAVGVFVNEPEENVARLLGSGVIDMAQLHGDEDETYIARLRTLTDRPLVRAFRIASRGDLDAARHSSADYILLDSGAGTGTTFDWSVTRGMERPFFLAGGLDPENVAAAIAQVEPFAVDVSSGIESDGKKDNQKMAAFAAAVRKEQ